MHIKVSSAGKAHSCKSERLLVTNGLTVDTRNVQTLCSLKERREENDDLYTEPLKEGFYCKEEKDEPFRFILVPLTCLLPHNHLVRRVFFAKSNFFSPQNIRFFFFVPEIEMRASRACLSDELACAVVYMYNGKACKAYKSPLRHSLHLQGGKTVNGNVLTNDRREKES